MDVFGLNDNLSMKINGVEFSGTPRWSSEEGFRCELVGFLNKDFLGFKIKLPKYIVAIVNKSKKYLIFNPYINGKISQELKAGAPSTLKFEIGSKSILKNMPWRGVSIHKVKSMYVNSNSLKLWNGTEVAEKNHDYDSGEFSVKFNKEIKEYECGLGSFTVGHNISPPGWPTFGVYKYEVHPFFRIKFSKYIKLVEIVRFARIIEVFFELLSSFPKRNTEYYISLSPENLDDTILFVAYNLERKKIDDNVFSSFLCKKFDLNLGLYLDKYFEIYDEISLLQEVVRFLSGDSIFLPEGFLMACNVIETIGQSDLEVSGDFELLINKIENIIKEHDSNLFEEFKSKLRHRLSNSISFTESIKHATSIIDAVGVSTKFNYRDVVRARARYRHNITKLTKSDVDVMMSFVSFAWVVGMVWLCVRIGIKSDDLQKALSKEVFHIKRNTQINLWGEIKTEN